MKARSTLFMDPIERQALRVKAFRERMLTLPEMIFLDLVRNYTGEIKTPYHKHDLWSRLEQFLRDPHNQALIREFLTKKDRQILSAILMLDGADEKTLQFFLTESFSPFELHLHLLNLQDRLLIYQENDSQKLGSLAINPLLEDLLLPALDSGQVIVSAPQEKNLEHQNRASFFTDNAVVALANLFLRNGPVGTQAGKVRKKVVNDFLRVFSQLVAPETSEEDQTQILVRLYHGLRALGLIYENANVSKANLERWQDFGALSQAARFWLWCGALCFPQSEELFNPEGFPDYFSQARIFAFAVQVQTFLRQFLPDRSYPAASVRLLWSLSGNKSDLGGEQIVQILTLFGLLKKQGNNWYRNQDLPPHNLEEPSLRIDGNFELVLTGQAKLHSQLALLFFADLLEFNRVSRWILNRESLHAGLAAGLSRAHLDEGLKAFNSPQLPPNVAWMLNEWGLDHDNLRYLDGILLIAKGPRALILDKLPELDPYILERPAEGMVLLDRFARSTWLPILKSAGLPVSQLEQIESPRFPVLPQFESLDLEDLTKPMAAAKPSVQADETAASYDPKQREALVNDLLQKLADGSYPPDLKEELSTRIKNGIVFDAQQLKPETTKLESHEAGGLDFQAKLRVIDLVIKSKRDFIEIEQSSEGFGNTRLVLLPTQVKASGNDQIIYGKSVPEGRSIMIFSRKILRVRRIRSGIFSRWGPLPE